jgi:hypothetical protein
MDTSGGVVAPTANEVRLQVERSRIWQREQRRIEGRDTPQDAEDQTPNDGEARVVHPNDDP